MFKENGVGIGAKEKLASFTPHVGVYMGGGTFSNGDYKALFEFEGEPCAARILRVFNETPEIERIVALLPSGSESYVMQYISDPQKEIEICPAGDTFFASAERAINAVGLNESAIVSFSDVPFLNSKSVRDLVLHTGKGIVIPGIRQQQVSSISSEHNLHFLPMKEGYIHLGNVVKLGSSVRGSINLERIAEGYEGRSFRKNPRKKLQVARSMIGYDGLLTAARIWLSANLQHSGHQRLDSKLPAYSLSHYEQMLTRLLGTETQICTDIPPETFLDYDYLDDAKQLEKNFPFLRDYFGTV